MFRRLKRALVESYVGAIAVGWLFATGLEDFADIFATPVFKWINRIEYHDLLHQPAVIHGLWARDAIPDAIRSVFLLVIGYILLRWLYYEDAVALTDQAVSDQRSTVREPDPAKPA